MKRIIQPPAIQIERLYTGREVGAMFGVRAEQVRRWTLNGALPPTAIVTTPGGHRRYRAAYIDSLLNGHQAAASP